MLRLAFPFANEGERLAQHDKVWLVAEGCGDVCHRRFSVVGRCGTKHRCLALVMLSAARPFACERSHEVEASLPSPQFFSFSRTRLVLSNVEGVSAQHGE